MVVNNMPPPANTSSSHRVHASHLLRWLVFFLVVIVGLWLLLAVESNSKTLTVERSLYRNIRVIEEGGIRCLTFSLKDKLTNQSCINTLEPDHLVFPYTKFLLGSLLLNDAPRHILIIGLGAGTLSNSLHRLLPASHIDNVEIDPAVIKVARQYFGFNEQPHIGTFAVDGRIFIKRALRQGKRYDLIILDAFNGDYIPEHLMTREFLQETRQLLSQEGVLAANTFAASQLYDHESVTYQAVFGEFINIRSPDSGNRVILAGVAKLPALEQLEEQAHHWQKPLRAINVDMVEIHRLMTTEPDWDLNARILSDQYSPANLLRSRQ